MRRAVCRVCLAAALFFKLVLFCGTSHAAFGYWWRTNAGLGFSCVSYAEQCTESEAEIVIGEKGVGWGGPGTIFDHKVILWDDGTEAKYRSYVINLSGTVNDFGYIWRIKNGNSTESCAANGEILNEVTGLCEPLPCSVGGTVQGSFYSDNGDLNNMVLSIQIGDSPVTASVDDCEVTYIPNYDDCYYSGEFATNPNGVSVEREICNVTFTKTGNSSTVGGTSDEGLTGPASVGDGCVSDDQGNVACGGNLPSGCGQINGVDVCFNDGQASCYDIGGTTICAGGNKNCGIFNGENMCVEQTATDSFIKFTDGSKTVSLSKDKGKTTTTVASVDNGDGTTTKTTTVTSNIVGIPDSVTTEVIDGSGNVISSETTGATGPDQGQSQNEFDTTGLATEAGQNSMINKLGEIKDVLDPATIDTFSIDTAGDGVVGTLDGDAQAFADTLGDGMPTSDKWLTWSPGFPTPQCQALSIVVPLGPLGSKPLDFDPCSDLQVMRDILGWFFYIGTAFVLVRLTLRGNE